jgi:hypothetical protein
MSIFEQPSINKIRGVLFVSEVLLDACSVDESAQPPQLNIAPVCTLPLKLNGIKAKTLKQLQRLR